MSHAVFSEYATYKIVEEIPVESVISCVDLDKAFQEYLKSMSEICSIITR